MRLNARQLRELEEKRVQGEIREIKRNPIYFILENIYDTYNIGGLFRLADALSVEKIYLCGETEIPPNHKIMKASVGTYKIVPWKYKETVKEAIKEIQDDLNIKHQTLNVKDKSFKVERLKFKVIAVEQSSKSIPYNQADYLLPLALIFGNESYGILPETLKLADLIVEIPMWGINKSLNVIVSEAIVSYWIAAASRFSPRR